MGGRTPRSWVLVHDGIPSHPRSLAVSWRQPAPPEALRFLHLPFLSFVNISFCIHITHLEFDLKDENQTLCSHLDPLQIDQFRITMCERCL